MKYIFWGDRLLAVNVLDFLIQSGYQPSLLILPPDDIASHSKQLIELSGLQKNSVFRPLDLLKPDVIDILRFLDVDYFIGIHYPYKISDEILNIPKIGFINLHPSFLPYNRGWHSPSWTILEKTPIGATLHFMSNEIDLGDIIYQEQLLPDECDLANTLYKKLLDLELVVFKKSLPELVSLKPTRIKQDRKAGTIHLKKQLGEISKLNLDDSYKLSNLITKLKALTTSKIEEAAYYIKDGAKYRVQVIITKESIDDES